MNKVHENTHTAQKSRNKNIKIRLWIRLNQTSLRRNAHVVFRLRSDRWWKITLFLLLYAMHIAETRRTIFILVYNFFLSPFQFQSECHIAVHVINKTRGSAVHWNLNGLKNWILLLSIHIKLFRIKLSVSQCWTAPWIIKSAQTQLRGGDHENVQKCLFSYLRTIFECKFAPVAQLSYLENFWIFLCFARGNKSQIDVSLPLQSHQCSADDNHAAVWFFATVPMLFANRWLRSFRALNWHFFKPFTLVHFIVWLWLSSVWLILMDNVIDATKSLYWGKSINYCSARRCRSYLFVYSMLLFYVDPVEQYLISDKYFQLRLPTASSMQTHKCNLHLRGKNRFELNEMVRFNL